MIEDAQEARAQGGRTEIHVDSIDPVCPLTILYRVQIMQCTESISIDRAYVRADVVRYGWTHMRGP